MQTRDFIMDSVEMKEVKKEKIVSGEKVIEIVDKHEQEEKVKMDRRKMMIVYF